MAAEFDFDFDFASLRLAQRCPALQAEQNPDAIILATAGTPFAEKLQALQRLTCRSLLTLPCASIYRPFLLYVAAGLVDDCTKGVTQPSAAVALALARLLAVAPHIEREVLHYFAKFPSPAEYQGSRSEFQQPLEFSTDIDLAFATLYGLQHSQGLSQLWKWPAVVRLLNNEDVQTRWCGIQSLAACMKLSQKDIDLLEQQLVGENCRIDCVIGWQNYCATVEAEKASMWSSRPKPATKADSGTLTSRKRKHKEIEDNSNGYVRVYGVDLPVRQADPGKAHTDTTDCIVVATPSFDKALEGFVLGLCVNAPILIEGPPGSGKSTIIQHMAQLTRNAADVISIHLDDQMDSKALFGAYVCSAKPGEFVWQPGPLTQAMTKGCWVVIEDINLAPTEILAALVTILEQRLVYLPSRAQEITAAPGFQLIATITTQPGTLNAGVYGSSQSVRDLLGGLFYYVRAEPPSYSEQLTILDQNFPAMGPLLGHAMASLDLVNAALGTSSESDAHGIVDAALASAGLRRGAVRVNRHFTFRDVMKWGKRMVDFHSSLIARSLKAVDVEECQRNAGAIPLPLREAAWKEVADCFCAFLSQEEMFEKFCKALGAIWAVPMPTVEQYTRLAKPPLHADRADVSIGRVNLSRRQSGPLVSQANSRFVHTGHSLRHLERIAAAASQNESVLLVGETGTGKTTLVQQLAQMLGVKLVVLNLNQQTDSSDLIGGFRPIQPADSVLSLLGTFTDLVRKTWQRGNNDEYIERVVKLAKQRKWQQLLKVFKGALEKVQASFDAASKDNGVAKSKKKQRANTDQHQTAWRDFAKELAIAETTAAAAEGGFAFSFSEGALVKAVREGWWLLLDEVNLAPAEALERIADLLGSSYGSVVVAERGDVVSLDRHPQFRLFAAMNPATDAGKRDLPAPIRNRFTEIWVGEPSCRDDLAAIVAGYLLPASASAPIDSIVDFYLAAKAQADINLQDGAGHKPTYNLRTLSRSLEYAAASIPIYGLVRAVYDGFAMSFLTQLDSASAEVLERLMAQHLLGNMQVKQVMREPARPNSGDYVLFDHFWVEVGSETLACSVDDDGKGGSFIATPTVMGHLRNLARAVLLRKHPILLQGPTSSGKTSLVAYIAAQTGHKFIRINNHEQTDLQEYLGAYVSDDHGRLVFKEGLLVQAIREGHWLVLDELNLAPSEVLEALNRLLDDNRELYIPELQEVVKPHPHFMLFATQNPPGIYAGRKTLSRAFRSRFLELHVDDIPDTELKTILEKRCSIAPSYAAKLVSVMRDLQRQRASSNVFAGRHGFITPRDLFRWAGRGAVGYQQLAEDGYAVLGERLRSIEEQVLVQQVIEKTMSVKLDIENIYAARSDEVTQLTSPNTATVNDSTSFEGVVWTKSLKRMYYLLERCLLFSEPALLVGETGTGKTTVCQLAALVRKQRLHIINCNQHTEVSDFIGGYRPSRQREQAVAMFRDLLRHYNALLEAKGHEQVWIDRDVSTGVMASLLAEAKRASLAADGDQDILAAVNSLVEAGTSLQAPFIWVDGPLIDAMKNGDMILIDELNLAEDAVLERLNSVLEPSRTLTLAEKAGDKNAVIVAHPEFRIVATMNPGGDFGKKELSPALSNRFTSIWVPPVDDLQELGSIVRSRLTEDATDVSDLLLDFWDFFRTRIASAARQVLSVRDLVSWIKFINSTAGSLGKTAAYLHGAHLVLLDGIGMGVGIADEMASSLRETCRAYLLQQVPKDAGDASAAFATDHTRHIAVSDGQWGIDPFYVDCTVSPKPLAFAFEAPTTSKNALRVLRALQVKKPVLLEGSPGVGKTSLVAAMAKAIGCEFIRINLSDQTDMMDLLGADLPVENGAPGEFQWSDGPLLQAIKAGAWVLLDELNLANQTVLEGLNAVLDHRAEVYVPELNKTFHCPPSFRLFGAQNPVQEGGGRKGLPRSFLNRFSRVHVELLQKEDLLFIAGCLHPSVPNATLTRMVAFCEALHNDANVRHSFASEGGPWEFNLRDLLRWCELAETSVSSSASTPTDSDAVMDSAVQHYTQMLFIRRLRTATDRAHALSIFCDIWGIQKDFPKPLLDVKDEDLQFRWARVPRQGHLPTSVRSLTVVPSQMEALESIGEAVARGWMSLVIGPTASGKTAVVRCLASLAGQPLIELSLTSSTDTSDLLGGFEQNEPTRKLQALRGAVEALLEEAARRASDIGVQLGTVVEVADAWYKQMELDLEPEVASQAIQMALQRLRELISVYSEAGGSMITKIDEYQQQLTSLQTSGSSAGKFEWVDGALTKAVEQGHWVLLDNVNLCNASVLDRLNALLEPNGTLYLNECGVGASGPRIITPHANFRLFLALDPKHGEVSRAMRNRGIEIFLLPDDKLTSTAPTCTPRTNETEVLLAIEHVPSSSLVRQMAKVHTSLQEMCSRHHWKPPSNRELKRWARLAGRLCSSGWDAWLAVQTAFEHIYIRPTVDATARSLADQAFSDHISPSALPDTDNNPWFMSGSWPLALSIPALTEQPRAACIVRDISPVFHYIGALIGVEEPSVLNGGVESPYGLATCVMLPGKTLARMLLGLFSQATGNDAVQLPSRAQSRVLVQCIADAAHVFAIRGISEGSPADYLRWALTVFSQIENVLVSYFSPLDANARLIATVCHASRHCIAEMLQNDGLTGAGNLAAVHHIRTGSVMHIVSQAVGSGKFQPQTLLELACFRYSNPKERARTEAPHSSIDHVWIMLKKLQELRERLAADNAGLNVSEVHEWQWAMLSATHLDLDNSHLNVTSDTIDVLGFIWLRLRAAIHNFTTAVKTIINDNAEYNELLHATEQTCWNLDATFGLTAGPPPKPLLWMFGGRPLLAKSAAVAEAAEKIRALSAVTRVTSTGYTVDQYGHAPSLQTAGITVNLPSTAHEDTDMQHDADLEAHSTTLEAVTGWLASDSSIRNAILEGASLFEASVLLIGSEADVNLPDIMETKIQGAVGECIRMLSKDSDQQLAENDGEKAAFERVQGGGQKLVMESSLMLNPRYRSLQLDLLSLQDLHASSKQLKFLSNVNEGIASQSQLEQLIRIVADSGCRDVLEGVPYQLLLWLLQTQNNNPEKYGELLASLLHEAGFHWHRGLEGGLASRLPSYYATAVGPEFERYWNMNSGPMRLLTSTITGVASAITLDSSSVSVKDRVAKQVQLSLAARHLGQLAGNEPGCAAKRQQEDVQNAFIVWVKTAQVYFSEEIPAEAKALFDFVLSANVDEMKQQAGSVLNASMAALSGVKHSLYAPLVSSLMIPALQLLVDSKVAETSHQGLQKLGSAWVLLGLARLHLLQPPPGADPAAKHALLRRHTLDVLEFVVIPELAVRQQYDQLPTGPDECPRIQELELEAARLTEVALDLDGRSPPRPTPSRYSALREDSVRFIEGVAGVDKVVQLLGQLSNGDRSGVAQAEVLRANALSWAENLAHRYPKYRDLYQPLQLAAYEMCHGLALSIGASEMHASLNRSQAIVPIANHLMAFPKPQFGTAAELSLSSTQVQQAAASVAAQLARDKLSSKVADPASLTKIANEAALMTRLKLLQCALHEIARKANSHTGKTTAFDRLHSVSGSLLDVWESIKEEEERRAAEEFELFKSKARTTEVLSEEQEAERDYHIQFPDSFEPFADLAIDENSPEADEPPPTTDINAAPLTALASVKEFLHRELLPDLIQLQQQLFSEVVDGSGAGIETVSRDNFLRAYKLGAEICSSTGFSLPARLDDVTLTGHLFALSIKATQMGENASPSEQYIDTRKPCLREAVLIQDPLEGLKKRIAYLLEEWPENPILLQLDMLLERVLEMPLDTPIKTLLTGLEFLLAKAQLWEETAAKHVTISTQLAQIAALATRWRRLELENWKGLLERTAQACAQEAYEGWFHVYRIIFVGDAAFSDVATVLEQFIQTSPIGQFSARLQLLHSFREHLVCLLAANSETEAAAEQRMRQLVAVLFNIHAYYSQFHPAVKEAVDAGLAPIQKELKDFVALAKWEDRGYYAMRSSAEKAQRQLHKLSRKVVEALREPASAVLRNFSKTMGIVDLDSAKLDVQKGKTGTTAALVTALVNPVAISTALTKAQTAAVASSSKSSASFTGKFSSQLPKLVQTFQKVAFPVGDVDKTAGDDTTNPGAAVSADEMAGEIASRAVQLKADVSKGAKARKKKAFTDLFRALDDAGVSKRRSAVPGHARGVQAWFSKDKPELERLFNTLETELESSQQSAARLAWCKSDGYYFNTMARVQKLLEAANQPHTDLSLPEVEAACRVSEHLLYLMQQGRDTLSSLSVLWNSLHKLTALISSLGDASTSSWNLLSSGHQSSKMQQYNKQIQALNELEILLVESVAVLQTAADAEPIESASMPLRQAATVAASGIASLQSSTQNMRRCQEEATIEAGVCPLFTPAMQAAVETAGNAVSDCYITLTGVENQNMPCWDLLVPKCSDVLELFKLDTPSASKDTVAKTTPEEFESHIEATVVAALLWAQNAPSSQTNADAPEDEDSFSVPKSLSEAGRKLGLSKLKRIVQSGIETLDSLSTLSASNVDTAAKIASLAPLLNMVKASLGQLAADYLALHCSTTKLSYVVASLFAGVVEEGFCMPQGSDEGEAEETDDVAEGTGLGEGDTRGAKDITDELEDQDQLLGAQKKGAEQPKEDQPQDDAEGADQPKGAEMDEDFDGALEDVPKEPQEDGEEDEDSGDEQDDQRLDQQMGDTGDQGEDVDERLWNGDDDEPEEQEGKRKEEQARPDEAPLQVDDASQLDYAPGEQEQPEEGDDNKKQQPKDAQQPREIDRPEPQPAEEEDQEGEEMQYEDRPEDRGFVQPEAPDQELDFPEDLNLDDAEGDDGEQDQPPVEEEAEEQPVNFAPEEEEMQDAFPEQPEDDGGEEKPGDGEKLGEPEDGLEPEQAATAGEAEGQQEDEDQNEAPPTDQDTTMLEDQPEEAGAPEAEAGTKGLPTAVPQSAGKDGAGEEEEKPSELDETGAALESLIEPPASAAGAATGAAQGMQDDATAARAAPTGADRNQQDGNKPQQPQLETNPFRNLGSAMERWKAKVSLGGDAPQENDQEENQEPEVAAGQPDEMDTELTDGGEFRFLGQNEAQQAGDTQALAPATAEQATGIDMEETAAEDEIMAEDTMEEDERGLEEEELDIPEQQGGPRDMIGGKAEWGQTAGEKAGIERAEKEQAAGDDEMKDVDEAMDDGNEEEEGQPQEQGVEGESLVVSKLRATSLDDGTGLLDEELAKILHQLPEERVKALRTELETRLKAASEGTIAGTEAEHRHGQEVWSRCEALTSGLVGELAEQLRLILEPTLASKLAGDYRSGKRINMRRVISYVASQFRKDKIWMRRTHPDKRRYQVVVAVDDSRSMAETNCGSFALEALTLICRSMSRLDVGQLGVVSFGGSGGAQPLHSLEQPFTDSDGVRIMSQMRFDQDNTINDQPMVDVITSLDHLLEQAAARAPSGYGAGTLHQLVLVIADGRFHEKESLKRAVREAASKPGVLYAFIVLDNAANSILDMQTVNFVNGQPVFTKYMDSFPFPFYIVLRDIAALPRTLADLLRQWFELSK